MIQGNLQYLKHLKFSSTIQLIKIQKDDLNVDAIAAHETKLKSPAFLLNCQRNWIIPIRRKPTTLQAEHLLNTNGDLEIKKVYTCGATNPREQVFIVANHPTVANGNDLLLLKRTDLRARADSTHSASSKL